MVETKQPDGVQVLQTYSGVTLNPALGPSDLDCPIPDGAKVEDSVRGTTYVKGGAKAPEAAAVSPVRLVDKGDAPPRPENPAALAEATPPSPLRQWLWILAALGATAIAVAIVLKFWVRGA